MPAAVVSRSTGSGKPKKLLEQARDVLRLKHYSLRTERSYCDWIKRFIRFHHLRHPNEMAAPEISEFLTHLARIGNVSASTQNQALSALVRCLAPATARRLTSRLLCVDWSGGAGSALCQALPSVAPERS